MKKGHNEAVVKKTFQYLQFDRDVYFKLLSPQKTLKIDF